LTPVEVAHNSAIPGHLGLISMMVGRKIRWDHVREVILDDAAATAMLSRKYRGGWRLRG
jgi:hypothetical protein